MIPNSTNLLYKHVQTATLYMLMQKLSVSKIL